MRNKNFINLIRSLVINYPIITSLGVGMRKPIAFVFSESNYTLSFFEQISEFPKIVTKTTPKDSIKDIFTNSNSNLVVLLMTNKIREESKNLQDKLEFFIDTAETGKIEKKQVTALLAVAFTKFVPKKFSGLFYEIRVDSASLKGIYDNIFELIPRSDQVSIAVDCYRKIRKDVLAPDFMVAAASLIYPKCSEMGCMDVFHEAVKEAEYLNQMEKIYGESDTVLEVILDCLTDFIYNQELVVKLPKIQCMHEDVLYWKENKIYFSAQYFKTAVHPLLEKTQIDTIKTILLENGIIIADSGSYTCKMPYFNPSNKLQRVRMICIDISKLPRKDDHPDMADYLSTLT